MAKARKNVASASSPPPSTLNNQMNVGEYEEDWNEKKDRGRLKWKLARYIAAVQDVLRIVTSAAFSLAAMALILASSFSINEKLQSTLTRMGVGYLFIAKPLLSTLAVCCNINTEEKDGKGGTMTRIIAFSFLMSIICNQFPKWLSAFAACCALFSFGLASYQLVPNRSEKTVKRFQSDTRASANNNSFFFHRTWSRLDIKERAAIGTLAVVVSLLTENMLIWVVSATYQPGINGSPEPLQDNGRIVFEKLATGIFDASWKASRTLQKLRDGLNVQWALVSSLGASFVCLELQLGESSHRSLAGLALHALMTLASARLIRTISFALTVVPSQVPNCYARHFPPPPEEWREWLMVGLIPNSRGGCNDLILSGHATVTSTLGCAFTSVASNTSFSIAVWTLIALDYGIEVYQGLHYSVDMWLGCIVTCLLWQLMKPLEICGRSDQIQNGNTRKESAVRLPKLNAPIVAMYAFPALLAFIILTAVPEAYRNYFFIGYTVWSAVSFARFGFTNLLQHVLLCLLCATLGTYL